jgi:tryptophanyl-tRNA synthetase
VPDTTEKADFTVTPWEVEGEIDYDRLVEQFGVKKIGPGLLKRIKEPLHIYLKRGYFFSHRDLDTILDLYDAGTKFALATGRGPSGTMTIAHYLPFEFTRWLQEQYGADVYIQLTTDEKFFVNPNLAFDQAEEYARQNALDIAAVGLDPDKTFIFSNLEYTKIYRPAAKIAKHVTFNTARSTFGDSVLKNIGWSFFPAVQAAHLTLANFVDGPTPIIVPMGIDQDGFLKIARDAAPKLGFPKPGAIHSRLLTGLLSIGGKMSASEPETAVLVTDSPEEVKQKIWNAFTGGGATKKEHMEKGGNPDRCVVFQWLYTLFLHDDQEMAERVVGCKKGENFCGVCKELLTEYLVEFLEEHSQRKKKAESLVPRYMYDGELARRCWDKV